MTRVAGDVNDQCPERGPGLSHTQAGTTECVHCGQHVVFRPRKRRRRSLDFDEYESAHLEFLRWLVRQGMLES